MDQTHYARLVELFKVSGPKHTQWRSQSRELLVKIVVGFVKFLGTPQQACGYLALKPVQEDKGKILMPFGAARLDEEGYWGLMLQLILTENSGAMKWFQTDIPLAALPALVLHVQFRMRLINDECEVFINDSKEFKFKRTDDERIKCMYSEILIGLETAATIVPPTSATKPICI